MSYSNTITDVITFTLTHARHLGAKVATDLKRLQRFYGEPGDSRIARYEAEITELLKAGYLGTVTYGYKRDGKFIVPTLKYTAQDLQGSSASDDDPGRVRPGADVSNATFGSFLTYSSAWDRLSSSEKTAFEKQLPFSRTNSDEPGVSGYLADDRVYSSGGRALNRQSLRAYS